MMKKSIAGCLIDWVLIVACCTAADAAKPLVLKADSFRHYVEDFNKNDRETYKGNFPNAAAWDFLKDNIPWLDCPDEDLQLTYYFRWWAYRKHIKQTPAGFIVDEFLPDVGWAGKYNSINCAAGHHLYDGRWLHDPKYLNDYSLFWFRGGGDPRRYSFWVADAIWARYCVTGDKQLPLDLLPDLIRNYEAWEQSNRDPNGLFWQEDGKDGGEMSIGGSGYRATINSYQFGDAIAIAHIAELAGKSDIARTYHDKAAAIKKLVQENLWDKDAQFFKVLPRGDSTKLVDVREEYGYTPWYFNLPDPQFTVAWKQLMDPQGFFAPFGPTTAEQRHPKFALAYSGHECQWNGPSWPYATAVTLTGLANLLNGPAQDAIHSKDYFELLEIYAKSQRLKLEDGRVVPWIDENLNPSNGDWIARTLLVQRKQPPADRGKDYNHSTFCDLVISGLIGLRPRADETLEVNPLVPAMWEYFCIDAIRYHGRILTILWDKSGLRYGKGQGLHVFADGREITASPQLARITCQLPPPANVPAHRPNEVPPGSPFPQTAVPKQPGRFIIISMPTEDDDAIQKVASTFKPSADGGTTVGIGTIISYLATPPDETVRKLKHFLNMAEKYNLPAVIEMDGINWWQARPDLWNWWDEKMPGYNPANRNNVEWTDWTADSAVKIGWRNWGRQFRVGPMPNLMSPAYLDACHIEMKRLVPIILDWWQALPEEKKHLLVSVQIGVECSIGANNWYYPNGNELLNKPENEDPHDGLKHEVLPGRGVQAIGYAAVSTLGIAKSGELKEEQVTKAVDTYVSDLCKVASDLGVPRNRLFTHAGGWKAGESVYFTAVNRFSCPGWSFYTFARDPRKDTTAMAALAQSDAPYWGAVEWLLLGTEKQSDWEDAYQHILAIPRLRYVQVRHWGSIKDNPPAIQAIQNIIR